MGGEGSSIGPTVNCLQHRRFDFNKSTCGERVAHGSHGGCAHLQHFPSLWTNDQVDITLAHARLRVSQSLELLGQRAQALASDNPARGLDRKFPTATTDHFTDDAYVVANVNIGLPRLEPVFAHGIDGQHDLQVT